MGERHRAARSTTGDGSSRVGAPALVRTVLIPRGCSDAKHYGSHLLRQPDVAGAIAAAMAERARRTGITPERVLEELARIAFVDWRKLAAWEPDGVSVTDSRALSPAETTAVARVLEYVADVLIAQPRETAAAPRSAASVPPGSARKIARSVLWYGS
ncbi:MAG TPA: terminase small subunit [Stellaceae bacterium]|nr:terminase small subunit [Stellaceae bacterium]